MINLNKRKSLAVAITFALVSLFSSCSRQMGSLSNSDKLITEQNIDKNHAIVQVQKLENSNKCIEAKEASKEKIVTDHPTVGLSVKTNIDKQFPKRDLVKELAQNVQSKAINLVKKQKAAIENITANHKVASYSRTHQTQGWIGLAITCLVVGIVLAFLGFDILGSLFWEIGIVLLVIGLIFFVLWLLAEAVS